MGTWLCRLWGWNWVGGRGWGPPGLEATGRGREDPSLGQEHGQHRMYRRPHVGKCCSQFQSRTPEWAASILDPASFPGDNAGVPRRRRLLCCYVLKFYDEKLYEVYILCFLEIVLGKRRPSRNFGIPCLCILFTFFFDSLIKR